MSPELASRVPVMTFFAHPRHVACRASPRHGSVLLAGRRRVPHIDPHVRCGHHGDDAARIVVDALHSELLNGFGVNITVPADRLNGTLVQAGGTVNFIGSVGPFTSPALRDGWSTAQRQDPREHPRRRHVLVRDDDVQRRCPCRPRRSSSAISTLCTSAAIRSVSMRPSGALLAAARTWSSSTTRSPHPDQELCR